MILTDVQKALIKLSAYNFNLYDLSRVIKQKISEDGLKKRIIYELIAKQGKTLSSSKGEITKARLILKAAKIKLSDNEVSEFFKEFSGKRTERIKNLPPIFTETNLCHILFHKFVVPKAKEEISKLPYRVSASKWAGGKHSIQIIYSEKDHVSCKGESTIVWSINKKWSGTNSMFTLWIHHSWLSKVYNKGIVSVDKKFILHAEPLDEKRFNVTYVNQARGFLLAPKTGIIEKQEDGYKFVRK